MKPVVIVPPAVADLAQKNLTDLRNNVYPGRYIYVGLSENGKNIVFGYAIMGRSESSRSRRFVIGENAILKTQYTGSAEVDTSLIVYNAMMENNSIFVVSNGQQTEDATKHTLGSYDFLRKWQFEPDDPNFTPRITARYCLDSDTLQISILKKGILGQNCIQQTINYENFSKSVAPGYGYCVHTYLGNGNPLPSFEGEPRLVQFNGNINDVLQTMVATLNEDNLVATAVKFIELKTGISRLHIKNKNGHKVIKKSKK